MRKKNRSLKRCMAVLATSMTLAGASLVNAGSGLGINIDVTGTPFWVPTFYANSPSGLRYDAFLNDYVDTGAPLTKFVDPLPGLCAPGPIPVATNPGGGAPLQDKCIPVAVADVNTYPGSDYYEIGIVEYEEWMHSNLPKATKLRGYVQLNDPANPVTRDVNGNVTSWPAAKYLGPAIVAQRDRPVRIKYYNLLPTGNGGQLFVPVDETLMGAGIGPNGTDKYAQNRAEIHLHGGDSPWISDGTPHQWVTPAGENTPWTKGASHYNVPDMADPGAGNGTLYYPNGDSARLMFYHDHTLGLTRVNVYAGEAAAYILTDPVEQDLVTRGVIPADTIPLVIQDKTFVPMDIDAQDAKWVYDLNGNYVPGSWGVYGDLWFPHVYEMNQDPNSIDGTNPTGRWDWGPWFWPIFPAAYDLPSGHVGDASTTPEAFMDTMVVNGTAYPTLTVDPKAYRVRLLNAANDRFLNLSWFLAEPLSIGLVTGGFGYDDLNPPTVTISGGGGTGGTATATVMGGVVVGITLTGAEGTGYTSAPTITIDPPADPLGFDAVAYSTVNTEVKMVPFTPGAAAFPVDGGLLGTGWGDPNARDGGVPDPATAGPNWIQIGTEGGFLPMPVSIPATPINYEYNRRSATVLNVLERGLYLGNAERADTVVDFSGFPGKTLILYNDAPAPVPASDPRVDYFTGCGDYSLVGGSAPTMPGYGPNTRTVMQVKVRDIAPAAAYDLATLEAELPAAYGATQPPPIIPNSVYNAAFGTADVDVYAKINTGSLQSPTFDITPAGPQVLQSIRVTGGGTGYRLAPFVNIIGGGGTGATATATVLGGKVVSVTLTNPGTGYTSQPYVTFTNRAGSYGVGATASINTSNTVNYPIQNKAIQELFEPNHGRMNATLGTELPFTSATIQTTIPLGYIDPTTETIADGETQIWKITHNGVDTHPVHFHLLNVQLINRVGWDGTIKPPDDNEKGWKETVKMNPLEDVIVALRAKRSDIPFGVPNSVRLLDPTQPVGSMMNFTQIDPFTNNPMTVTNQEANFGWEYVWHCHILGHEENDFMRPFVLTVIPVAPTASVLSLTSAAGEVPVVLGWTDPTPAGDPATIGNLANEIGYRVLRAPEGSSTFAQIGTALANATTFTDTTAVAGAGYNYKVEAWNEGNSTSSNTVTVAAAVLAPAAPTNLVSAISSGSSIRVTWNDASNNETQFIVYRSVNGGAFSQVGTVARSATQGTSTGSSVSFNNTGLTSGNTYAYYIVAANGATLSDASSTVTVVFARPVAPSNLAVVMTNTTTANITWTDNSSNETNFTLQRAENASFTNNLSSSNRPANSVSATQTLELGKTYYFRIRAVNGVGPSAYSATFGPLVVP